MLRKLKNSFELLKMLDFTLTVDPVLIAKISIFEQIHMIEVDSRESRSV